MTVTSTRHTGARVVAAFALAAICGCAVGPDFHRPAAPTVERYTATPLPAATAAAPVADGESQRFAAGGTIPAQWWTLFRSKKLEELVAQALKANPTLAAAEGALRQAAELRRAQFGAFFPALDGTFSAERSKISGATFGQPDAPSSLFTLYNASLNLSYNLDPFGGNRRRLEAAQSQVDYQEFLLEGARLTLAGNIVTTAVQEGSLRGRIRALSAIIASQEEQLKLVELRQQLGAAALSEVLAQQAVLADTRAALPPLEKALAQTRHLLAVLAGRLPQDAGTFPEFELEDFVLPQALPVSLPSEVVRQRPDVRASESLLHTASAEVGVARADRFPALTITGSLGSQSSSAGSIFSSGTMVWNLGAGLTQPLFRGGELKAREAAARAAYDEAEAQYRNTILSAFREVADVLRALEVDARALKAQAEAEGAAAGSLVVAQEEYRYGATSYPTLLNAIQQQKRAELTLIEARAARLADSAALLQALGGGWWNRERERRTE
ncbi:efflux transporter outer membrane subunit [Geomonas sp. RF6]|uniref:efflux transporter outer membrane subunit n=1 Tax=Geomonas sp. RF6 TaxID=2897342 RepID=UPI001E4253EA|nr:efflux transporter outer membrane subunit [Geomonas sp. RF6]UFS71942.1 efflux transporter outer membrane subunit [Geomonas sp. RF6]